MESRLKLSRIAILGVPLDVLPEEGFEDLVASLEDGTNHQIILLSVWDLMRARKRAEFRTMVAGASLVIPISLSIIKAAHFLKRTEPKRYQPFDFVVRLLGVLERRGKSAYLLGSSRTVLQRTEANLKSTYPGLKIVGRHTGNYPKQQEASIVEAVRKASPTLLLAGRGIPGGERWIPRNLPGFNAGIYLWCSDLFSVFAHARRRPSDRIFERGFEWIPYTARRPWMVWRVFVFAAFKFLVLVERIRQRY
jgi:N-acetylglucosaminyldiphosphoundecaprenol N-acetyl-beta-D-mannosaminyltransferase